MRTIKGPYEFGDQPPKNLMGWLPEIALQQNKLRTDDFPPQKPAPTPEPPSRRKIWQVVKTHNADQHLPTFKQQVGDCVGAGLKQMGDYLTFAQIGRNFQEQYFRPWHCSWLYGMSRVAYLTSAGQGDGSTGRAGALVVKNLGVYFEDWQDAPPYSGALSRQWGDRPGPPQNVRDISLVHVAVDVQQLRSANAVRTALLQNRLVTIASLRGFAMQPVDLQGFHVFHPSGSWSHQMCFLDWMDDPFPAAYRMNSWGPNAHGTPLNDEPPGGAWNLLSDLEEEFKHPAVECFAFRLFNAWPTKANYNILHHPDHRTPAVPYN